MPTQERRNAPSHANGWAIRDMRLARNYTAAALAEELTRVGQPTSPNTLTNIERGHRDSSPELIASIAHVLRCNVTTLLRCPGCVACRHNSYDCPVCQRQAREAAERVFGKAA